MSQFGDARDRLRPLTLSDLIQIATFHEGKSVHAEEVAVGSDETLTLAEWRFQFPDAVYAMRFVDDMTTTDFPVWANGRVMQMGGPPRGARIHLIGAILSLTDPVIISARLNSAWMAIPHVWE